MFSRRPHDRTGLMGEFVNQPIRKLRDRDRPVFHGTVVTEAEQPQIRFHGRFVRQHQVGNRRPARLRQDGRRSPRNTRRSCATRGPGNQARLPPGWKFSGGLHARLLRRRHDRQTPIHGVPGTPAFHLRSAARSQPKRASTQRCKRLNQSTRSAIEGCSKCTSWQLAASDYAGRRMVLP